jgi:sugar/nucleoside kinase (ribokinase family)
VAPGARTRYAFILIDAPSAERTVCFDLDERSVLRAEELTREEVCSGRVLHLDITDVQAAIRAATWAREEGVVVSIDIDHVAPGVERLLPLLDLCIVSENFPRELTGETNRERALRHLRPHCAGFLATTLGAEGCIALLEGDELVAVPAFPVQAVDTTACGDVFHAAFIFGMLRRWDPKKMLRFACAAAALKTRALGGRPGIPTLDEVEAFLASRSRAA